MRCIIGFAAFVVLYFSSCIILGGVARAIAGPVAEAEVLRKYHALAAVGAGVVTLIGVSLPWLLSRPKDLDNLDEIWPR